MKIRIIGVNVNGTPLNHSHDHMVSQVKHQAKEGMRRQREMKQAEALAAAEAEVQEQQRVSTCQASRPTDVGNMVNPSSCVS